MADRNSVRVSMSLHDAQFLRSTLRMVPAKTLTTLDKQAIEQFDASIKEAEVRAGLRLPT